MKKKVLLYCEDFDPPHLGHIDTAILALNYMKNLYGFEKVLFVPMQKDVFGLSSVANNKSIRNMLSLILKPFDEDRFELAGFEINMSSFFDIIKKVEDIKAVYNPRVLIRLDHAQYMSRKLFIEELTQKVKFVIINKEGNFTNPTSPLFKEPNIFIKQCSYDNMSLSCLRSGTLEDVFMDDNVLHYIKEQNIYFRSKGKNT